MNHEIHLINMAGLCDALASLTKLEEVRRQTNGCSMHVETCDLLAKRIIELTKEGQKK